MSADAAQDPIAQLPPLRAVIEAHGLWAEKRFGQNFLLDLNLTRRIARAAGALDQGTVIEVGPGPGGLTRALLLEGAGNLVVIEKDARFQPALATLGAAAMGRLCVIEADALSVDVAALGPAPRRIVANLPYNVATPLLIGWLKRADEIAGMTLMFQREVAERITARVGEAAYGRLSVLTGLTARAERLFDIPPRAFVPAPKVVSTVVGFVPRPERPDLAALERVERVTAAAFGQRRKMLRQSLRSFSPAPEPWLEAAGIDPTARAEMVPPESFLALAEELP